MTTTRSKPVPFRTRSTYGPVDIARLFNCTLYHAKAMIDSGEVPVMRINLLKNPKRVGHVELLRFLRDRPVYRAALDRFEAAIRLDAARRKEGATA
jgi:hypothetical protein